LNSLARSNPSNPSNLKKELQIRVQDAEVYTQTESFKKRFVTLPEVDKSDLVQVKEQVASRASIELDIVERKMRKNRSQINIPKHEFYIAQGSRRPRSFETIVAARKEIDSGKYRRSSSSPPTHPLPCLDARLFMTHAIFLTYMHMYSIQPMPSFSPHKKTYCSISLVEITTWLLLLALKESNSALSSHIELCILRRKSSTEQ